VTQTWTVIDPPGLSSAYRGYPTVMGTGDKIDSKADEFKGKAKEAAGNASDDPDLKAEGKTDQSKGNLKGAKEKVKDAFKD